MSGTLRIDAFLPDNGRDGAYIINGSATWEGDEIPEVGKHYEMTIGAEVPDPLAPLPNTTEPESEPAQQGNGNPTE